MKSKHNHNILERVNEWLLKATLGCAVVYFLFIFRTFAYPMDISLKGRLPFNGEISLKGIGLSEENNKVSRLKEFTYFAPSRISLSSLVLEREGKTYRIRLHVNDLGENDVYAALAVDAGKWFVSDNTYNKIPHYTSLTDYTLRSTNTFSVRLLPLNFMSIPVVVKEEDKVGAVTSNSLSKLLAIGQKEQYWSLGMDTAWKFANLSINYEDSRLKQPQLGSDLKSTTLVLQNAQEQKDMYCGLTYNTTDIASRIAGVNNIEIRKWKFETSRTFANVLNVEGSYATNKRTNKNAGNISTDAKSYSLGASYQLKDFGKVNNSEVSLGYRNETKDYTNAEISKEGIKTWTLSGKTKVTSVSVKANYEKSDKDVTGASATLQNFNELAYAAKSWGVSFSTKPIMRKGQISATYYLKRGVKEPALVSGYGINSIRTNLNGATISYLIHPKVTLTYNWVLTEWRKNGSFKYNAAPDVDAVLSVFDNNEFHQGIVDFELSEKTSLSAGYWESNSEMNDSIYSLTKTREQEVSLSGNHAFSENLSLSVLLKRNIYKDPLNTTLEGQTNYFEAQLTKKF